MKKTQNKGSKKGNKGSVTPWIFRVLLAVLALALVIVVVKSFSWGDIFDFDIFKSKTEGEHIVTILQAIKKEAVLETVSMIEMSDNRVRKKDGLCDEKVRYIGYFTVFAGIDLAEITEDDIVINTEAAGSPSVVITLPPAQILHTLLNIKISNTIIETQLAVGFLCSKGTQMPQIIKEVQAFGSDCATKAAIDADILGMAEEQAGKVLKDLLIKVGYSDVEVKYSDAIVPEVTCENWVDD